LNYRIEKLNLSHSSFEFDCGDQAINEYFSDKSYEDVENKNSQVYVFIKDAELLGFYAISMSSVYTKLNNSEARWPVTLLGQLGVNLKFQGQRWGSLFVLKAIEKAILLSNEIGCVGLIVHTYNKSLIDGFYKKLKFNLIDENLVQDRLRYTLFRVFKSN